MALVPCKECGTEVAESAPTCPKCGVPNPAGKTCRVVINRKKAMTGFASRVEIAIDELSASIGNGESLTLDVAPGAHSISAACANPGGAVIERGDRFELTSGQTASYECGFSGWSGFYFKRA
jgi:predicted RNA-binding Zn-ribbon protein involved in translation (DUF1610 family)